ncbi:hypothetical protein J6590_033203 [Homalodisca vitripennis]|nr:hypothetical protein J6590_033203 [Homalodisca vitripennis]
MKAHETASDALCRRRNRPEETSPCQVMQGFAARSTGSSGDRNTGSADTAYLVPRVRAGTSSAYIYKSIVNNL